LLAVAVVQVPKVAVVELVVIAQLSQAKTQVAVLRLNQL
jgi:hypothetical protein